MKKIVLGLVAALGIATPAMATDYTSEPYNASALESYLLNEFSDKFTQVSAVQIWYEDTVDGISVRLSTAPGSTTIGFGCATTSTEMSELTTAEHTEHLNNVAAADWWFGKSDALDSHNYWEDRIEEKANSSTSGVAGIIAVMEATGDDFLRKRAGSACYSEWIGYNGEGIKDYITLPAASYNQHVVGMIAAGEAQ